MSIYRAPHNVLAIPKDTHASLAANDSAHESFPKRTNPNTEMIVLEDPQVDMAVRKALIQRANESVDLASFAQTTDHFGMQLITALRTAQDQGVRVRSIFEKSASKAEGDSSDHGAELLADTNLVCPDQILRK